MAYTAADLTKIETAIMDLVTGERVVSVTYASGHSIEYGAASLSDLRQMASSIRSQLGTRPRAVLISSSKGL